MQKASVLPFFGPGLELCFIEIRVHTERKFPRGKEPKCGRLVVELVEERCGVKSELGGTRQVVGGDPHHLCTLSLRP